MGDDGTPLLHQCLEWARKLSNDEIRTALRFLHDELKGRLKEQDTVAALALRPGDWVEMTKTVRRLPAGARGQVTATRRGRIDVHFPDFKCYTMPASMVRKVDGPPAKPAP
jgi:hypothetical protein